jgi:hypothetical protein
MAVGDDAVAGGYPLVPATGDDGLVKWGSREINRTRDFVAQLKKLIPTTKLGFRNAAGISYGYQDPSGGDNGDIYFKIVN